MHSLAEAIAQVYGVPEYMKRYVNGLLLSQVFWQNHAYAFYLYQTRFLPGNRTGYDHLEVGPGHGLFAAVAGEDPNCVSHCLGCQPQQLAGDYPCAAATGNDPFGSTC